MFLISCWFLLHTIAQIDFDERVIGEHVGRTITVKVICFLDSELSPTTTGRRAEVTNSHFFLAQRTCNNNAVGDLLFSLIRSYKGHRDYIAFFIL